MSTDIKTVSEIKEIIQKWWSALQYERKCNSTNTVFKIVSRSSEEIQQQIRQLISEEIKIIIENCRDSRDVNQMQRTCNAINGCFDNFIHAVDAVRLLFKEVIEFIHFGLEDCHSKLILKSISKNTLLELLHSLSRILILVLKLQRTQNSGKVKSVQIKKFSELYSLHDVDNLKKLLVDLTYKIGQFLIMDDILIDTKNNLSMSGILIREILVPDESKLVEFHRSFVNTIPVTLREEDFKLNILKFLTSSAIINTWPVNIIDTDSTYTYLIFFISLCENYSSETPIILNTSRTLLLLIKHESFKQFIDKSDSAKVKSATLVLLSCVFMLLEHPVACVRHSAKEFLHLLAGVPSLQFIIIDTVFKLPADKRCYFISIGALANEVGSRILIERNNELPKQLLTALTDPTIVSHVSLALECMILKDSLAEENFSEWCETWIVPLLVSLMNVLPIVAADIDKLLEKAFKKSPNAILYITSKWAHPASEEELRYVITALKISQKQGFKIKANLPGSLKNGEVAKNNNSLDLEDKIFNEELIEHCLHQRDDDIRVSTFSLLIEAHKSTKPYSETDFRLIMYFLKYNLNNHQPATRQKILGLIRKMLVRFSESKATFLKFSKNNCFQAEKSQNILIYDQFLNSLLEFCFSNIFIGCNFNRLNTVLNILLLCFEYIKEIAFDSARTNFYWSKLLIALDSSYEENKELAVTLTEKLDMSVLQANEPKAAKILFEKAFSLCIHMEPPDVLTGSYLLQALMNLPCSKEVLLMYFDDNDDVEDVRYCCIKILVQKLKEQMNLAKLDLMTAATCGPMYGTLFAIRLMFKKVEFFSVNTLDIDSRKYHLKAWAAILNDLIEISFDMAHIVGCVVNSSSPEGHLPMDFQTDLENILSLTFAEECSVENSTSNKPFNLLHLICDNFLLKFNKIQSLIESSEYDAYETLRTLKSLIKENQLLIDKVKILEEKTDIIETKFFYQVKEAKSKLEKYIEKLEETTKAIDWPATAQVLLLCAWRSIKEASLYLGDLVTKIPIETQIELGLLDKTKIIRIGEELKTLLCEIKHRGAFEHAYIGFTLLVNSLWKCTDNWLRELPRKWLEEIINQLESPLKDQKMKLCSTRRSAGLPFLVQAIICSEIVSVKSSTPTSLHTTMKSLLNITENGVEGNPESKIHALNVLRALFKHAQLGEHVASYVSRALMVAVRGSRAATWPERNSSSLLFSSLIIRIFGVARSKDEISKKNRMTSRTFFQRYSELYDFLLSEMEFVYSKENHVEGVYPKPSLYLVLLILGRLYPPPTEGDPENIDLSEFLPYINMSRENPTMKIRELGARALVSLISLDRLVDELHARFSIVALKDGISPNERHGVLLQIKSLLNESVGVLENLTKLTSREKETSWVQNTKWMLMSKLEDVKKLSFVALSTYVKVLHLLFKNCSYLRDEITKLVTSNNVVSDLLKLSSCEQKILPGVFLFLENFFYLKTDVLGFRYVNDNTSGHDFTELFMFMLKCTISEVQSVPFRILRSAIHNWELEVDDDDFNGIAAPVNDLLIMQSKENVNLLRSKILSNPIVIKFLVEQLNENNSAYITSKIIHRIWLSTVSVLVMNDKVSVCESYSHSENFLKIDFAKCFIKSGDKDFSTSSLICYGLYLMNKVSLVRNENRVELFNIINEFSCKDADVKERLAVSKILTRSFRNFIEKIQIEDPHVMNIWMVPFKLLLDEDPTVRLATSELVQAFQDHILKHSLPDKLLIKMNTLDWPHLPLIPLKAQECLLDSYINILGNENLPYLVTQMLIISTSALTDLDDPDGYSKDEFGVFEKGNPNPFCEEFALSDLMCQKLSQLKETVDLETVLWKTLDSTMSEFIAENLNLSDCLPETLMEVVETVTVMTEDKERLSKDFSLARLQVRSLRKVLGLQEVV